MNILLVAPASGGWHGIGRNRVWNGRSFRFSLLSLLTVAAATPPGHRVEIVDEQVDRLDFDRMPSGGPIDLVGLTAMTAAAPRAYELAAAFRARGIPVVMGGMHPTFLPDEALGHVDAVVAGEAETVWPTVVADALAGRMAGLYRAEPLASLAGLPRPPRHLIAGKRYATVQAVQATRGCPHRCTFCSVSAFHGGTQRFRPPEEVAAEVASFPHRFFVFVDDNLTADRAWVAELFRRIEPLGRRWISQATLAMADDGELVDAAARAGCIGLFTGVETFSAGNLASVDKEFNRVEEVRGRVERLHAAGIGVEAGLVFGFDGDEPEVFHETLAQVERAGIDLVQTSILTPLPGTPFFRAMEGRIFERDWGRYDYHHAVFHPKRMTAAELEGGHDWFVRQFYRPWRIARRAARRARVPRSWRGYGVVTGVDAAYYGRVVRWGIRGFDPAARRPTTREALAAEG